MAFTLHASEIRDKYETGREKNFWVPAESSHFFPFKKFCTGGAKMWRFSGRMWLKTSQVKKIFSCARASHSSQKCDKCDASHFLSPEKVTNVTSLTKIWDSPGSWEEIRVRPTLTMGLTQIAMVDLAALWRRTPQTAQVHHRSGCMGGTVSSASLRLTKLTPLAAPVRSCAPFWGVRGDLLQWRMQMVAVRIARLAATLWVCMGQQSTQRSDALLTFLRPSGPLLAAVFIVDQGSERACWQQRRWRRRYLRTCGWVDGR